jgi:peptidoglycan LD-endopeptidase LytH
VIEDVSLFSKYVDEQLANAGATYGVGGYAEHRTVYSRSHVFDAPDAGEPRRLHLGTDIWGKAGTPVAAPIGGMVHSFQFNDAYGDYGATIILLHQLERRSLLYLVWTLERE